MSIERGFVRRIQSGVLLVMLVLPAMLTGWPQGQSSGSPSQVSETEAEILIYLLPSAQQLRSEKMDIEWYRETSPTLNQRDFYNFMVVNASRRDAGSVTIGTFSVNRWTAEVWDFFLGERISGSEIEGVQKILRKAHRVDAQTVERYQSLKPE